MRALCARTACVRAQDPRFIAGGRGAGRPRTNRPTNGSSRYPRAAQPARAPAALAPAAMVSAARLLWVIGQLASGRIARVSLNTYEDKLVVKLTLLSQINISTHTVDS